MDLIDKTWLRYVTWKTLLICLLLPPIVWAIYKFGIYELVIRGISYKKTDAANQTWRQAGANRLLISMGVAIVVNLFLDIIIPANWGVRDPEVKRRQWKTGAIINFIIFFVMSIIWGVLYDVGGLTFGILLGYHLLSFPLTFILGSLWVARDYRKAFFLFDRKIV